MQHTTLPFFGIVRVTGDDRHNFLHNQLSNDINSLQENQACYATYNSPKGRVIANMIIANQGTSLDLILSADLIESVVRRLKMFVLRAKVQFEIPNHLLISTKLPENPVISYPASPTFSFPFINNCIQLPNNNILIIEEKADETPTHNDIIQHFMQHEIQSGYPWISQATSESCVAQMLNQHLIGGVHFRKGCYPGQEIIARAQYRGQVKRGLALATLSQTLHAGTPIFNQKNEEVGIVINSSENLHLLVIKHSAVQELLINEQNDVLHLEHCFFSTDPQ